MQADVNIQHRLPAGTSCKTLLTLFWQKKLSERQSCPCSFWEKSSPLPSTPSLPGAWAVIVSAIKLKMDHFHFLKNFEDICYLHSFSVNQTGRGYANDVSKWVQHLNVRGKRAVLGGIKVETAYITAEAPFQSSHTFHRVYSLPAFPLTSCPSRCNPDTSVMWAQVPSGGSF